MRYESIAVSMFVALGAFACSGAGATVAVLDASPETSPETSTQLDGGALDATNPHDTGTAVLDSRAMEDNEAADGSTGEDSAASADSAADLDTAAGADTSVSPDTGAGADTSVSPDSSSPVDSSITDTSVTDSNVVDSGAAPDTGMKTDAGCSVPPLGQSCDPGIVECAGSACAVPASFCCATTGDANVVSESCVAAAAACDGIEEKCDETADCPGSDLCCLAVTSTTTQGIRISCQPTCTGALVSAQVCKSNSECPGGVCIPQSCTVGGTTLEIEACGTIPTCTPLQTLGDGGSSVGFAGTYSCNVTEKVNVTAPLSMMMSTTTQENMIVTESGGILSANLVGDGGLSGCTLTLTDDGNGTATLSPATGQSCNVTSTSPVGLIPIHVTFTMGGNASLAGLSLKADNFPVSVTDGPGGTLGVMGTGTLSLDCTKL